LYVLVQFAKFALLEIALKLNTFKSNRYLWMDAGASRFFGDFDLKKPLTGRKVPEGQFLVKVDALAEIKCLQARTAI
jgi:hypothetical protein